MPGVKIVLLSYVALHNSKLEIVLLSRTIFV